MSLEVHEGKKNEHFLQRKKPYQEKKININPTKTSIYETSSSEGGDIEVPRRGVTPLSTCRRRGTPVSSPVGTAKYMEPTRRGVDRLRSDAIRHGMFRTTK
ncbi:hypothetical protein GWI33_013808 [Rhynchophorus ferrugineus]|uniref:Uncharacterized protein n=1 Tax=Rhynchophorus ferrugineus TaxID=354439 RepID=A0A834I6C4_RHYFE|nr:hypothetical protein GWI33_013808 [Rhynchophorus ferrugineus]